MSDDDEDDDPFFDDEGLDDEDEDDEDECGICGGDHEDRTCDTAFCSTCWNIVDNCDCDPCNEVDAAVWIDAGRPPPVVKAC